MQKFLLLIFFVCITLFASAQKLQTVYLDAKDSTANMYIAVLPENTSAKALLFLLDGFGAAPQDVLQQTALPFYAAKQGILTIIPVLKTGPLYFGVDSASQQSLQELIKLVSNKYHLQGAPFYIGGFSIGGGCAVKYTERAVETKEAIKPKAVFAVDPPLDWEHYYNAAQRVVRLSANKEVNGEVTYMINRIEKEMGGTPKTALVNYYNLSPYSFSDTTQRAVKTLATMPIMLISEPDIQWWLRERGYDYDFINVTAQAAMINELQRLGNRNAILVTTTNKGYRKPANKRHPHSWSIADTQQVVQWLLAQK